MSRAKKSDIESLLAERARFETWLEQLAAKASQAPSHVADRVRSDYEARLAKVLDELRSRADDLESEVASLESRLSALEDELTHKRDARAEDELRAMVGEYEPSVWERRVADHDEGIAKTETERNARQSDVARVREMLAEATRPSRPAGEMPGEMPGEMRGEMSAEMAPEPEPAPAPVAAAPPPRPSAGIEPPFMVEREPEAPAAAGELTIAAEPSFETSPTPISVPEIPTTRRPSPFDEIGFLRTVVGGRPTPMGVDTGMASPPPPPVAPPPPPPPPPPPARASVPTFEPPPMVEAPEAPPSFSPPPSKRKAAPEPSMFDEPVAVVGDADGERAARADAARTLKCQECGWMNYPTEWYCEKCGGELAAF